MNIFLVSQVLAGIAFISDMASFQFKARKTILLCLLFSSFLLTVHFFLLESYLSAGVVFLSLLRFLVAYYSTRSFWIYIFIGLTFAAFLGVQDFSFQGYLALLAGILFSISAFQKTDKRVRLSFMLAALFWIPHVYLVGSPMSFLVEIFFLLSNLVGYFRYYLRKKL